MASEARLVWSRIPAIAKIYDERAKELVDETAQEIATDVRSRWAHLSLPIRVRGSGKNRQVVAGSTKRFYAGFVEFGTEFQSAQPAMTPAAEAHRASFVASADRLEDWAR